MCVLQCGTVIAQIEAPDSVEIGVDIEVTWKGEPVDGTISIVNADGSKKEGGTSYGYLSTKKIPQTAKFRAPVDPGEFAFVLTRKGQREQEHLTKFTVIDVAATLKGPESVSLNETFELKWSGPTQGSATIAILSPADAEKRVRYENTYTANAKGAPVKLRAPKEPGTYRIVYEMRGRTLTEVPLTVIGAEASLSGPAQIGAGSPLTITWQGPDNKGDLLGFAEVDGEKLSGKYSYLANHEGNAVTLTAPEKPGKLEIVYMTGGVVLARHPIEVTEVTATLAAPAEVVAGTRFEVKWTGPGNYSDRVQMHQSDEDEDRVAVAYLHHKESPIETRAPFVGGDHVLRYVTARGNVLAERPIKVTAAPQRPGLLNVTLSASNQISSGSAVEVILDASGSMLQRQGGETRIAIAREVLIGLLGETIPAGTPFALRVFGHKEPDSCRTDLEIPLAPLEVDAARKTVAGVQAMNLAKTPIADSLRLVASDLKAVTGERIVILLTDGEETCGGDPAREIETLRSSGTDVRVNIVGYAIDDPVLQDNFEAWAALGGGEYFEAADAEQLSVALKSALEIPYEVRQDGKVITTGTTGYRRISLMPGDYQVVTNRDGNEVEETVTINSEKLTTVELP
ncbi:MAG: VWA domain-containing protein [Verrucomicrobiota bacterium]